jgi:hypothetical protein
MGRFVRGIQKKETRYEDISKSYQAKHSVFSDPTFPSADRKEQDFDFQETRYEVFRYPLLSLALTLTFATPTFAAVRHTGKAITNVTVVTETNLLTTNSTSFVNLPGGAVTIVVPAGHFQLVQATFSSESYYATFTSSATAFFETVFASEVNSDGISQ